VSLLGVPLVGRVSVGGGVTCGLLVAASTPPVALGLDVAASTLLDDAVVVACVVVACVVVVVEFVVQLFARVHGTNVIVDCVDVVDSVVVVGTVVVELVVDSVVVVGTVVVEVVVDSVVVVGTVVVELVVDSVVVVVVVQAPRLRL
jgi:hypothetical protein